MPLPKKRRLAAAAAAADQRDADVASHPPVDPPPTTPSATASDDPRPSHPTIHDDDDDDDGGGGGGGGRIVAALLKRHLDTVDAIRRNVSSLVARRSEKGIIAGGEEDDGDDEEEEDLVLSTSAALSNLKSIQRQISLRAEARASASRSRRERCESLGLAFDNLAYERDYLRGEIDSIRGWRAEALGGMALSELGINPGDLLDGTAAATATARSTPPRAREAEVASSFEEGEEMEEGGLGGGETLDDGDVDMADGESEITTLEGAIDAYLFGECDDDGKKTCGSNTTGRKRSHRDPDEHEYVLEKLQSDLRTRATLVERLSKSKLELKSLTKRRDELRGFLNGLPSKLVELERAGEGLSKFFGSSGVWGDVLDGGNDDGGGAGGVGTKISAANLLVCRPSRDRSDRFRLARSNLPSPLYVLYVQLAGYIDAWSSLEKLGGGGPGGPGGDKSSAHRGFVGVPGMDVSAIPGTGEGGGGCWTVALTLAPSEAVPPEVSSALGGKASNAAGNPRSAAAAAAAAAAVVRISFSYDAERGVVRATSEGGGEGGYDGLLDGLFPGDDGLVNPNASLSLLSDRDEMVRRGSADDDYVGVPEGGGGDDRAGVLGGGTTDGNCVGGATPGKPYFWCQVLGGLDFPPPPPSSSAPHENNAGRGGGGRDDDDDDDSPFPIETCTRAVFRQLLRRVRARRTLSAILEYLGGKHRGGNLHHPLPVHPAIRGGEGGGGGGGVSVVHQQPHSVKAKVHSWVEDSKAGKPNQAAAGSAATKSYSAIIKRKASTLKATVVIDAHNYPAEPPVWSLLNEDGSSGMLSSWGEEHGSVSSLHQNNSKGDAAKNAAPPLFDAALHRIECRVNRELDGYVRQDVEATYDWILIHQLADIVSCWDEAMSATEGGGGGGAAGSRGGVNDAPSHGRTRRGKDRRIVGFGERSPFFWYRNGL